LDDFVADGLAGYLQGIKYADPEPINEAKVREKRATAILVRTLPIIGILRSKLCHLNLPFSVFM
jgi:hypothetical protein